MAFESIQVSGPEPAERREPGIQLLKWFGFQPVKTALCVHGGSYETGLSQYPQVLRHSRLRHTQLPLDLSNRSLRRDQETQYRAPVRLRNDFEYRFHPLLYTPPSMYLSKHIWNRKPPRLQRVDRVRSGDGELLRPTLLNRRIQ